MKNSQVVDNLMRAHREAVLAEKAMAQVFGEGSVFERVIGHLEDGICQMVFGEDPQEDEMILFREIMDDTSIGVEQAVLMLGILHDASRRRHGIQTGWMGEDVQIPAPKFSETPDKKERPEGSYEALWVRTGRR